MSYGLSKGDIALVVTAGAPAPPATELAGNGVVPDEDAEVPDVDDFGIMGPGQRPAGPTIGLRADADDVEPVSCEALCKLCCKWCWWMWLWCESPGILLVDGPIMLKSLWLMSMGICLFKNMEYLLAPGAKGL